VCELLGTSKMVNTKPVEPVRSGGLPLAALNHISVVCRSLESSVRFYRDVLGFVPIRRPGSFDFDGAWCVPSYSFPGSIDLFILHTACCTQPPLPLRARSAAHRCMVPSFAPDVDRANIIFGRCERRTAGCSTTASASISCRPRTPRACPRRRRRSTPRTTTSPSRYACMGIMPPH